MEKTIEWECWTCHMDWSQSMELAEVLRKNPDSYRSLNNHQSWTVSRIKFSLWFHHFLGFVNSRITGGSFLSQFTVYPTQNWSFRIKFSRISSCWHARTDEHKFQFNSIYISRLVQLESTHSVSLSLLSEKNREAGQRRGVPDAMSSMRTFQPPIKS